MIDNDGPFHEIVAEAERVINAGATVFQKFTCEACLARQTMDTPNAFYTSGKCDECGHITQLKTGRCGFMLVQSADPEQHRKFVALLTESIRASQPRNRN